MSRRSTCAGNNGYGSSELAGPGDRASGQARDTGSRQQHALLAAHVSMLEDARTARTLEDAAVRQMGLALRLMRLRAQSCIRNWLNRTEQPRLLPRLQHLLK